MNLEGTFVALVTPFKNGKINEEKIRELVRLQIENGTDGIVPCGTTGESPALSEEEKNRVIEIVIEEAKGKALVIAGTGTNNTEKSVKATAQAKEMGADAALVITPYYNKPTQAGLIRHFEAVAEVNLPIMIYNVPGRTSVNILPSTIEKLSKLDQIVAIKEASGDLNQVSEILTTCKDNIKVFSGDDSLFAPILAIGGVGVVSVVANLVPQYLKSLYEAFKSNEIVRMQQLHHQLFELCQAMFYETNPAPVKTAMNLMGMDVGELRPPLAPMAETNKEKLIESLKVYGLLK
ncbi:4-hydroxy-tetrahydrodipicolinate synthase [candidate division KSB1 bacterium]|nr:4-hydroxy-tetrahydrodipicolinate synthase [candidate division KSB1 bacterium]MCH8953937.1 4-hydroxy-tetrahydrodipicolinate synthase [candidate division KSB1 bacterium]